MQGITPEKLDQRWRTVINTIPVTDNMDEFLIVKFLVQNQDLFPDLAECPLIFAWEYPFDPRETRLGQADLIFWNGVDRAVVIEVKFISSAPGSTASTRRTRHRGKVQEQSYTYAQKFQEIHPEFEIKRLGLTNELLDRGGEASQIYRDFAAREWATLKAIYDYR